MLCLPYVMFEHVLACVNIGRVRTRDTERGRERERQRQRETETDGKEGS